MNDDRGRVGDDGDRAREHRDDPRYDRYARLLRRVVGTPAALVTLVDHGVVSYAGWPVTDHTGSVVGALCAVDRQRREWTDDDREALSTPAAGVSADLTAAGLRAAQAARR